MFRTSCVLVKLCLITCVVAITNVDNSNKTGKESKLADSEMIDSNISHQSNTSESSTLDGTFNTSNQESKQFAKSNEEEIFLNITQTFNESNKTMEETPCKEVESLGSYEKSPVYAMDNATLKHATVERDSAGLLRYFEMHVAVRADEYVAVYLWDTPHTSGDKYFYICKLEFGAAGASAPLISDYDAGYRSLKYFQFGYEGTDEAIIRYDCPLSARAHAPAPAPAPARGAPA